MNAERSTSRRGFLRSALAALGAGAWLGRGALAEAAPNDTQGVQPYISEIRFFAGGTPPAGWLFCEGQLLPINNVEYEALFILIGTQYGGDGQFTFALPDLRGRVPIHRGTSPGGVTYIMGETGGDNEVALSAQQIPAHTHTLAASTSPGDSDSPAGRFPARDAAGNPRYAAAADVSFAAAAIESTGGNQSHENRQPFIALHAMIAYTGVFPSQS